MTDEEFEALRDLQTYASTNRNEQADSHYAQLHQAMAAHNRAAQAQSISQIASAYCQSSQAHCQAVQGSFGVNRARAAYGMAQLGQDPWLPRYPDPTPEDLANPVFDLIWSVIKSWDVGRAGMYSGATGNYAKAILDAIRPRVIVLSDEETIANEILAK